MKQTSLTRIRIIAGLIFIFALLLVGKLYLVQVVSGATFSEKANRQYTKPNQSIFDRGTIYFSNKDGSLIAAASLKDGFTLAMIPKEFKGDVETSYENISKLYKLDHDSFVAKAGKKDDPYEELAKHVDADVALKIQDLKISGIAIYKDRWRFYPAGKEASHVIGFVGSNSDNTLQGRYGLERSYESTLSRSSQDLYVNFFAEIFANLNKTLLNKGSLEGDVVTGIEPTVQNYIEKQIAKINGTFSSDVTGAIVIDPTTGQIYAMAAEPSFDPNSFKLVKDQSVFTNPLVENVYEMGSIIKPLTLSAGIDLKAITAKTTYTDSGFVILDGKKISNFDGKGRGVITMQHVLNESLNTGVAFAVSKMGKENFARYMTNFGLGELTGIDLPNEAKGIISNLKSPRDVEYATASFGQGIAMSPITTVRALSALGNGGSLVTPHVAKSIKYTLGYSKDIHPASGRQVITPETSHEITRMLVEAVDTALVGGTLKMEHYSVAAKTGTAQIPDAHGGYYEDRVLHSFFGYFPAYNPRFLVFLYTKNPHGAPFAAETLAHPFIDITKFLINYYEIPPDR